MTSAVRVNPLPWLSVCPGKILTLCNNIVASIDAVIAAAAFVQLIRIYLHNPHARWTRQKTFHLMVFCADAGYAVFFFLSPIAVCHGWSCWQHVCGFTLLSIPQIIFLATFLLLLSFWVDQCHQATDTDDDDDEDDEGDADGQLAGSEDGDLATESEEHSPYQPAMAAYSGRVCPPNGDSRLSLLSSSQGRKVGGCFPKRRRLKVRGRQRMVVGVVLIICLLTGAFAILIWVGLGDNGIDSQVVAHIHADVFALVILLSGGSLAFYGLMLYTKLSRLRAGKATKEISKVAWLAVICLVCFSIRAFIVLAVNIPILTSVTPDDDKAPFQPVWFLVYYIIGEAVPSAVVLFILKDMPARSRVGSSMSSGQSYAVVLATEVDDDGQLEPHWLMASPETPAERCQSPSSTRSPISLFYVTSPIANIAAIKQSTSNPES